MPNSLTSYCLQDNKQAVKIGTENNHNHKVKVI